MYRERDQLKETIQLKRGTLDLLRKNYSQDTDTIENLEREIENLENQHRMIQQTNLPRTNDAFFDNSNLRQNLTVEQETSLLEIALSLSLDSKYVCKITSNPEKGMITGQVKITRPDKKHQILKFNKEKGYRAMVRLSKNRKIIYEGYMYYRMACFNPVRSETDDLQVNVQFEKISQTTIMIDERIHTSQPCNLI